MMPGSRMIISPTHRVLSPYHRTIDNLVGATALSWGTQLLARRCSARLHRRHRLIVRSCCPSFTIPLPRPRLADVSPATARRQSSGKEQREDQERGADRQTDGWLPIRLTKWRSRALMRGNNAHLGPNRVATSYSSGIRT